MSESSPGQCLSDEALQRLLVDEAAGEGAARHIEACAACQARLEQLAGAAEVLGVSKAPASQAKSNALSKVIEHMRAEEPGAAEDSEQTEYFQGADFLQPSGKPGVRGTFSSYEVLGHVASGGMGMVFKARDPSLNRIVAIKVLSPALAASESARARFLREARAAAAVAHEHVVAIHAVGEERNLPYLVMQFVQGKSLQARLAGGPLELNEILRIGMQAAQGLAAAHAQGLIHRDIKPANILLENSVERVKLTDFGLARAVDEPGVTKPGVLAGTPEYMSPEQARGERADARSDLFGLGCVLYAMATGRSPFAADSTLAVLRKVCETKPQPVHEANPSLPQWLSLIIARLLAKRPEERFQTAADVAGLLENCLAKLQSSGNPNDLVIKLPSPAWPLQRTRRFLALAASLVLLATAVAWLVFKKNAGQGSLPMAKNTAFNVLATDGSVTSFTNLNAAIAAAAPGGTIEVRGSGTIPCPPVAIRDKPLRIQAARGSRPILLSTTRQAPLILAESPLVLEGLEFRSIDAVSDGFFLSRSDFLNQTNSRPRSPQMRMVRNELVLARGASLFVANCRFVGPAVSIPGQECIAAENVAQCDVRNSDLYNRNGVGVLWKFQDDSRLRAVPEGIPRFRLENCVAVGTETFFLDAEPPKPPRFELVRNTILSGVMVSGSHVVEMTFAATNNVFDLRTIFPARVPRNRLNNLVAWHGHENLYNDPRQVRMTLNRTPGVEDFIFQTISRREPTALFGVINLSVRMRGRTDANFKAELGHFALLPERVTTQPPLTPEKLRTLGADVKKTGPGAAYDAWRASPEYQAWHKQTSVFLSQ